MGNQDCVALGVVRAQDEVGRLELLSRPHVSSRGSEERDAASLYQPQGGMSCHRCILPRGTTQRAASPSIVR